MRTHYEILEVTSSASRAEIVELLGESSCAIILTKEFLMKTMHSANSSSMECVKDVELRSLYDESLRLKQCHENDVIHEEIKVSDMEYVPVDEYTKGFTYKCRCSGEYQLEYADAGLLQSGQVKNIVISCNYCSSCLQVSL